MFPSHYKLGITLYQNKPILVELYQVWSLFFWGSCNRTVNTVDWNQFNTGSNPVPIETFEKNGRIDHLWVINPLKSQ